MSYGPGRSRLATGLGTGVGAWLVGTVLVGVVLLAALDTVPGGSPIGLGSAYPIAVLWFLAVSTGQVTPLLLVVGTATTGLLVGAGAVAALVARLEDPRDGVGLGVAVAAGHGLGVAITLAWLGPIGIAANGSAGRAFTLVFGGFMIPVVLAIFGAVGAIQVSG